LGDPWRGFTIIKMKKGFNQMRLNRNEVLSAKQKWERDEQKWKKIRHYHDGYEEIIEDIYKTIDSKYEKSVHRIDDLEYIEVKEDIYEVYRGIFEKR
jgi:hypothetical protein